MLSITQAETEQLKQCRSSLADILATEDEYRNSDAFLTTWLRHKKHNVVAVDSAFRTHSRWRLEQGIANIHAVVFQDLASSLPYRLSGSDRLGRPVVWISFGRWNLAGLLDKEKQAAFLAYGYQFCQVLERAIMEEDGKRGGEGGSVWQFSAILDLEGFSLQQLLSSTALRLMTSLASTAESNWPLRGGALLGINAPRIVQTLLGIIKPFLSTTTKSGIEIYGSNRAEWEEALRRHIDPAHIPTRYGGQMTFDL